MILNPLETSSARSAPEAAAEEMLARSWAWTSQLLPLRPRLPPAAAVAVGGGGELQRRRPRGSSSPDLAAGKRAAEPLQPPLRPPQVTEAAGEMLA